MLRGMSISKRGPFSKAYVPLSQSTVVVGGPESGKTTLLCALRQVCTTPQEVRGKSVEGVEVDGDNPPPLDETTWVKVAGAAEGQLAWVDPKLLSTFGESLNASLAERLSTDELSAQIEALRADHLRLRNEIARLDACGRDRAALYRVARTLRRVSEQIEALRREAQRDDEERKRAEQLHQRIDELEAHAQAMVELDGLRGYSPRALAQFDHLNRELQEHLERMRATENRQEVARGRVESLKRELSECEGELLARKAAADQARALVHWYESQRAVPSAPLKASRRSWWFVAASGLFAAAVFAAVWWEHTLGSGVLGTLGVAAIVPGLRRGPREEVDPEAQLCVELVARWNARSAQPMPTRPDGSTRIDEVRAFLDEQVQAYHRLHARYEERVRYKCRAEADLTEVLGHSHKMLVDTLAARQAAVDAWLQSRNLTSRDTYAQKVRRKNELQPIVEAGIASGLPRSADAVAVVQRDLRVALQALAPLSLEEREQLNRRLGRLEEVWGRLQRRWREHGGSQTETELLEEVARVKGERRRLQREVHDLRQELMAKEATRGRLEMLLQQPNLVGRVLADAMMTLLDAAGMPRRVEITLDAQRPEEVSCRVADARGAMRCITELGGSAGDLAFLALRLVLADALPDVQLLVLEEPFLRMTDVQHRGACRMLALAQSAQALQLVVITRDAARGALTAEHLTGCSLVDLDRLKCPARAA